MFIRTSNAQEDKELIEIFNNVGNEKSKIALAVAQHYGRKTRCLDFTRNYKIALSLLIVAKELFTVMLLIL